MKSTIIKILLPLFFSCVSYGAEQDCTKIIEDCNQELDRYLEIGNQLDPETEITSPELIQAGDNWIACLQLKKEKGCDQEQ